MSGVEKKKTNLYQHKHHTHQCVWTEEVTFSFSFINTNLFCFSLNIFLKSLRNPEGYWPAGLASRPVSICRNFSGFSHVPSWDREWLTIWKKIPRKFWTINQSFIYSMAFFSVTEITKYKTLTSSFWISPSWLRSNRLKTSSVLRESSGWFDSSCSRVEAAVWLSIRPLSWASCTTTRHSSSVRKLGISDKNRIRKAGVRTQ